MPRSIRILALAAVLGTFSHLALASELTEEWGYDRKGNDYDSFRAPDLAACKSACRRDRRCKAYTLTNDRVCYLKDRINSKKQAMGAVTGYRDDSSPEPDRGGDLTEEPGYDRKGDDYTSFRARGLDDCRRSCADDDRCQAYTYDTRTDRCYLKSRINSAKRAEGMVTGYRRQEGSGSTGGGWGGEDRLTEERGYDRKGSDYTSFRTRGLSDCKAACAKDQRCVAYTFDTRNDACYLKNEVREPRRDDAMVTGVKARDGGRPGPGREVTEERGYDRKGNDYTSFRARSLDDCQDACRRDERCRAYTFDTRNGACYLKDEVNEPRRDDGMVTGTKREE